MTVPGARDEGSTGASAASGRRRTSLSKLAFLGFSALVLSPNLAALVLLGPDAALQPLGWAFAVWILWAALWRRMFWACALVAPLLLLAPVEVFLLARYGTFASPHIFGLIFETNPAEAAEFMQGLTWVAGGAVLAMLLLAGWTLRQLWRSDLIWTHRSRWWVLLAFLSTSVLLQVSHAGLESGAAGPTAPPDEFRIEPPWLVRNALWESFPAGLVARYVYYRKAMEVVAQTHSRLANFRFGAKPLDPTQRQAIVLVIGESARADRWAINGYARPTSPQLSTTANLVSFRDVVSIATATRLSVPIIVTRKPAERVESVAFAEPSVVSLFKEAGFHTVWLSNQAAVGQYDTPISVYAKEADELSFLNPSSYEARTTFDEVLLRPLQNALMRQDPAVFIVVHVLGSHFNYRQRYPDQFDRFQPSPAPKDPVSLHDPYWKDALNNAYDNSILYSDHILAEVINALKASGRERALMLYVSDHGEDLFDDRCAQGGHGRATINAYRIPAFVWYSDAYAAQFPDKVRALQSNRSKRVTTEAVVESLADAAALTFPTQNSTFSLFSPNFVERPRRVLASSHLVNFDRSKVGPRCEIYE